MINILITGVAGLIGSNLSTYLIDNGYNVIGIDDLTGGYIDFVDSRVDFHKINLLDYNKLNKLFKTKNIDYVYHLAAYAAEGLSPFIRTFNYTNNIIASSNIINCCVNFNIKKLIFTSSMAVYGEQTPPFNETQSPKPIDPYGIAKFAIEMDLETAYRQFGLNYTIIRPHNVVGVNQNIWDKYRNVIGIWIRQVINNQDITVFGDGLQERAFSDVKYYMKPFENVLFNHNREIFNIGADENYKLIDVANIIKEISIEYGYKANIIHLEKREEAKIAFCNHDKAKSLLSFDDKTDLKKMIKELFEWILIQPNRVVKKMEYEIEKNIYSYWK